MKASIVELRYNMKDILKALDRNEVGTIIYRGQEKAKMIPTGVKLEGKVNVNSNYSHRFYRGGKTVDASSCGCRFI